MKLLMCASKNQTNRYAEFIRHAVLRQAQDVSASPNINEMAGQARHDDKQIRNDGTVFRGALILIIFVTICHIAASQEDSLRAYVNHVILPDNKVESYIDVNDSVNLFIDAFEKKFGEVEEIKGVYNWTNVEIDSVGKSLKIKMLHGIWTKKKNSLEFNPVSPEKIGKLKTNEKRGVRIRVFLKDGKDALISKSNEIYIKQIIESMLNNLQEPSKE